MKKITRIKFANIKNGMMSVKDLDDETVKIFTKGYDEKDVEITKLKLDKLALEYRLEIADELITKQLTVVKQLTGRIVKEYQKSNTIIAIVAIGIVLNLIALFAKVIGL